VSFRQACNFLIFVASDESRIAAGAWRRACKRRSPPEGGTGAGSKHVQHAVAEWLGGFQSIAEIQELVYVYSTK